MKKVALFLVLVVSVNFITAQEQIKKDEQYIQSYARIAIEEMELYKIPASITLAQGILETGNGQSDLAKYGNNHFGIKCKNEWTGDRMYHDDDKNGECFRKYPSVKDSYRDHSLFLAERPYYKNLFLLDPKDYKAWAHGLKKAGYATNPKYAYTLINLIEKYSLNQFDHISSDQTDVKLAELYPNSYKETTPQVTLASSNEKEDKEAVAFAVYQKKEDKSAQKTTQTKTAQTKTNTKTNNFEFPQRRIKFHPNRNLKYIVFKDGDTLEDISKAYDIPVEKLKAYNDLTFREELEVNQKIFLEAKRKAGIKKEYTAKEGDKMYDIAQNNGISLIQLYKRNLMLPGQEPKKGDKILLKGNKR
ncbi:MAG: glucosaminidase domain-containing protein [Flavobacteriaceae bacterium]|jgi:LysM repeat protein|nr:glucosaminidase domain-containing protein [Flavobacteriaceae bacterium]